MPKNSIQKMMIIEILLREKKTDLINKNLNMIAIHKELSNLDSSKTQMDYDATSFYTSALWERNVCLS